MSIVQDIVLCHPASEEGFDGILDASDFDGVLRAWRAEIDAVATVAAVHDDGLDFPGVVGYAMSSTKFRTIERPPIARGLRVHW